MKTSPRDAYEERHRKWTLAYLKPLIGARILGVKMHGEWPALIVLLPDQARPVEIEVSSDEEGNGPGFLHGLAFPSEKEVGS